MIKKSFKLLFTLAMIISCIVFSSFSVFAEAKVGDQLTQPEEGWKRYDDVDGKIDYTDFEYKGHTGFGRTISFNGAETTSGVVKFKFKGTKLRLICITDKNKRTPKADIYIDNNKYSFTCANSNYYEGLVFEEENLKDAVHDVVIRNFEVNPSAPGTYSSFGLNAIDINEDGELLEYPKTVLDVEPKDNKIKVGQEVALDITLDNVTNIGAEDLRIKYDTNLLEYVGIEDIDGIKVYDSKEVNPGELRFIVASKGTDKFINKKDILFKLKFRAKQPGEALVDIIKGRIATIEKEWDVEEDKCGETTIIIEGFKDVNKSGEFTLVDLAIDGSYYKFKPEDTDVSKYDADVVVDAANEINDIDLTAIAKAIQANENYEPNKY